MNLYTLPHTSNEIWTFMYTRVQIATESYYEARYSDIF